MRAKPLETVLQDLSYAFRMLRRAPCFTVVAVITLTLGIGANTATFSAVNAVLFRPLPLRQPGRIVRLQEYHQNPTNVKPERHLLMCASAIVYFLKLRLIAFFRRT
jgi:hypothetical protein